MAAALDRREGGEYASLVERLADDSLMPLNRNEIEALLANPQEFTGTAIAQVARVVARANTVLAAHPEAASAGAEVRV